MNFLEALKSDKIVLLSYNVLNRDSVKATIHGSEKMRYYTVFDTAKNAYEFMQNTRGLYILIYLNTLTKYQIIRVQSVGGTLYKAYSALVDCSVEKYAHKRLDALQVKISRNSYYTFKGCHNA